VKHTIICADFKPYRKNTLIGFATIRIAEMKLTVHDVAIHEKGSSRWAQFPAKPQIDRNGVAIKDRAGKIQYVAILELDDRKTRDAFSHAVIAAVLAVAPRAFDEEVVV
jgi:hypothetical protein